MTAFSVFILFCQTQKPEPAIPFVSASSASMREQVVKLFKELREIMDKFSTVLIALLAAKNAIDTEANPLFKKQHVELMMMFLVLIIVLYHLTLVIRTVLVQLPPQNARLTRLLHILAFIMALLGGCASVLALVII